MNLRLPVVIFISILLTATAVQAQPKSPEAFLGYKIGYRFTPYWQVVNYINYLHSTVPNKLSLIEYGTTNENRPLYLAVFASPDNMKQLEQIRENNLALAGLAEKNTVGAVNNQPVIIWLSYNVHGNEASSTEAALLTRYELANDNNTRSTEWLKNCIIIIDPCVNPDGRERYTNWYNSIVGKNYNPQLHAREHREPWPGGRSNHYNFDLNRDWAWQTQVESEQRIKQYNRWMPQVHVDFHEQGINQPYYFAPAAAPYHNAITTWQRNFQKTIGNTLAKYFDKNNWLYFTREIFDLFYPSYGDTYPTFNGAIGMTYEQAGSGSAGLGAATDEGDTLTLVDRAQHHFIAGLGTIEAAALHSTSLVSEFKKYFDEIRAGNYTSFKTFVIKKTAENQQQLKAFIKLLQKNNIAYNSGNGNGKGYNYLTAKETAFTIQPGDVVINTNQPRGLLAHILLEPHSSLTDSVTYDITSWSLPYAYGLNAYACKTAPAITLQPYMDSAFKNHVPEGEKYGYIVQWQGMASARMMALLLQQGVKLRYAEKPFEVNNRQFNRGSFLILKKGNEQLGSNLWQMAEKISNSEGIALYEVKSGMVDIGADFGSQYVHPVKPVSVALFTGAGISSTAAGDVWHYFDNDLNYPITLINVSDFGRVSWKNIDVVIMPSGYYGFLQDKNGAEAFKQWIASGGTAIAIEDAVTQLSLLDWVQLKPKNIVSDSSAQAEQYTLLKKFEDREKESISESTPGAVYKVQVDNTHPLFFGYPDYYYSLKMDKNLFYFVKEGGWNAGYLKKDNQVSGFVGNKIKAKFEDGLLFGSQKTGAGNLIFITDNVLFRNFWENGKLIMANALFFSNAL